MSGPSIRHVAEWEPHECDCDRCDSYEDEWVAGNWKIRCCSMTDEMPTGKIAMLALARHLTAHHGIEVRRLTAQVATKCKCENADGYNRPECEHGVVYVDRVLEVAMT